MKKLLRFPTSLRKYCLKIVVDNFDSKYIIPYLNRWHKVTEQFQPNFGPFADMESSVLILIIEELIRRETLRYEHLKVLLPVDAKSLTCDEDSYFCLFQSNIVELIGNRCADFEDFHYHQLKMERRDIDIFNMNPMLTRNISRLNLLHKINLSDTPIDEETIQAISRCPFLNYLNLNQTNLSDEGLHYLHDEESDIKESLTTLIIDKAQISELSVIRCLMNLPNLTHFQFDRTIEACLWLFENLKESKQPPVISEFKTTIFKSKLNIDNEERMTPEFQQWLIESFPKVSHLILISVNKSHSEFINRLVTSWKNISHLELSSSGWKEEEYPFHYFHNVIKLLKDRLIILKLENFINIDLLYLACFLRKLEKLSFINCTFLDHASLTPFFKLRELEVVFLKHYFNVDLKKFSSTWEITNNNWLFLLASKYLEKLFVYDQSNFVCKLSRDDVRSKPFKFLQEASIYYCPLRIDSVMELLNEEIPLKKLEVGFCPFLRIKDYKEISDFIWHNKYATSFIHAKDIPYRLRWIVVGIDYLN